MKEYKSPEFEIVRIVFNRDVMVYLASVETDIPDIEQASGFLEACFGGYI